MASVMLERIENDVFRVTKFLEQANILERELLEFPTKFILAVKMCDGTLHKVNSHIEDTLKLYKEKIKKGHISDIICELSPDETLHGKRFVIFKKTEKEAYLLGDVAAALNKFSK